MIELKVESYCHGCVEFEPVVSALFFNEECRSQIVQCVNNRKCRRILDNLNEKFKEKYLVKEE